MYCFIFTYNFLFNKIFFISAVTPLSVTLSTESVVQPAGSTVWVDCITSPKDNVQINWDKDGIIPLLPASGKEPGDIYVLSNDTLKIVNLKRRQAGTYKCIATLKDTTVLKKVVVTLSCRCTVLHFKKCILFKIY